MNKVYISTIYILLIFGLLATVGCNITNQQKQSDNKTRIITSILPLTEFVGEIGGDKVTVESMIPPGFEPHAYELSPAQLVSISKADLYIKAGQIEFEKANIDNIIAQNPDMKIIDGSDGIILRKMADYENERESIHEHEDEKYSKDSDQVDPHTWLSTTNAKIYVQNIANALSDLDPENKNYYQDNKEKYLAKLDQTDYYLKEELGTLENKKIIVYHPAFGYLLQEYGLEQTPIEIDGKEPTADQLQKLITEARKENIKIVFVQKQFSSKNAEAIAAEIDGKVVQIDPLAANFVENLRNIGDSLSEN